MLSSIVTPIFIVVDTLMWSCTQIVYGVITIFNLNVQLVSAILLAINFAFHQLTAFLYLIVVALAAILQSCVLGVAWCVEAMGSVAEGSSSLLDYAKESLLLIFSGLAYLVPNTFKGIFTIAMWLKQSMIFLVSNILPIIEQAGGFVVAGLKALISYSAHFTVVVAMSITTLFTLLIHGLYKLFALTVYTVYSALNETYQFFIGNAKTYETENVPWTSKNEDRDVDRTMHFQDVSKQPVTLYQSFHESVALFVFQVFDVLSYLAICIAMICAVIAIITLLYCLYSNAMSSVNALVTLFHRSIFRSERSIIIDTPADNIPGHHAVPVPHILPRNDFLDDLSDAESEDSVHLPGPHTPVPINDDDEAAAGRAGPSSGIQQPRRRTPRPNSRTSSLLSTAKSESSSPTGGLARDLCRQLEEERDRQLCVVCQDNEKHILIFPCKHLCICIDCVEEIASSRVDRRKCPLCRGQISSYLEVYA